MESHFEEHCKLKVRIADFRLFQISNSDFRFQIPGFRFQIAGFRFQTSDFRFQISDFRFQIPDSRFQIISDFAGIALRSAISNLKSEI